MTQKNVEAKAECTGKDGEPTLTVRVKPEWEGIALQKLNLSDEQKDRLTKLYHAQILLFHDVRYGKASNSISIGFEMFADASAQFVTKAQDETRREWLEREKSSWQGNSNIVRHTDNRYDQMLCPIMQECIVFNDAKHFFRGAGEVVSFLHPQSDPILEAIAESPAEVEQINDWLKEHGIENVRWKTEGGFSLLLETNGDYLVRIQSKKEPKPYSTLPQVMQPIFSTETEHAYIDIVPTMPGTSLGGKETNKPEVTALENALLRQGEVFHDSGAKNVMLLPDGTPIIVDMSAVRPCKVSEETLAEIPQEAKYEWLLSDGTQKLHAFCPWLADDAPDKKERFKKEAMNNGSYEVSAKPLDTWLTAQENDRHLKPYLEKVKLAQQIAEVRNVLGNTSQPAVPMAAFGNIRQVEGPTPP